MNFIDDILGTMSNPSLPGGNFMADVVAQNLLSQQMTQMITQAVSGNHIYEQMKQIMSQSLLGNHLLYVFYFFI